MSDENFRFPTDAEIKRLNEAVAAVCLPTPHGDRLTAYAESLRAEIVRRFPGADFDLLGSSVRIRGPVEDDGKRMAAYVNF